MENSKMLTTTGHTLTYNSVEKNRAQQSKQRG